jgi:hypothetical protein
MSKRPLPYVALLAVTAVVTLSAPASARTATASSASCVASYSAATLASRTWAFDGTVVRTGNGRDSHLGSVPVVTFRVHRWYKGGSDRLATVQFSFAESEDQHVRGGVGTRLLVSGEPRWGGKPLDDRVAWGGCGFTRRWSATAAKVWAATFPKSST